jgi:hypothetical protein
MRVAMPSGSISPGRWPEMDQLLTSGERGLEAWVGLMPSSTPFIPQNVPADEGTYLRILAPEIPMRVQVPLIARAAAPS